LGNHPRLDEYTMVVVVSEKSYLDQSQSEVQVRRPMNELNHPLDLISNLVSNDENQQAPKLEIPGYSFDESAFIKRTILSCFAHDLYKRVSLRAFISLLDCLNKLGVGPT
jgi:hypothetical protein